MRSTPALLGMTLAVFVASCSSGTSSSPSLPVPAPPAPQRLYVSDVAASPNGHIYAFQLPLTAASAPIVTLSGLDYPAGLAFDSTGRLFVSGSTLKQGAAYAQPAVFTQPITTASSPAFLLSQTYYGGDVAVNAAGTVVAIENQSNFCCLEVFTAPTSAASTAAFSISFPSTDGPEEGAFDASGNLFISGYKHLYEFTPPLTASSLPAATFGTLTGDSGVGIDSSGRLYEADGSAIGKVDVYTPPYTNASTPSFSITVSANYIGHPTFDAAGNLYVTGYTDNKVYMFTPPFSASSTPALSVTVAKPYGAAVGP